MKTSTVPVSAPKWVLIDADGVTIGKVAVKAAMYLRGKHRASFSPHQLCGDHVIVINVAKLRLPPKKGLRMMYHRHTGYPGNMRHTSLERMMDKKPTYVIEHAVKGMLPSNRLAAEMLRRLHVFVDAEHPYAPQKPLTLSLIKR
jgi:large subunit ribosomal protein L13